MLTLISFLLYIFRSMLIGLTAGTIYIEYRVFKKMSAPTCIAVGLASTPMYISLLNYLLGLIFVGWPSLFFYFVPIVLCLAYLLFHNHWQKTIAALRQGLLWIQNRLQLCGRWLILDIFLAGVIVFVFSLLFKFQEQTLYLFDLVRNAFPIGFFSFLGFLILLAFWIVRRLFLQKCFFQNLFVLIGCTLVGCSCVYGLLMNDLPFVSNSDRAHYELEARYFAEDKNSWEIDLYTDEKYGSSLTDDHGPLWVTNLTDSYLIADITGLPSPLRVTNFSILWTYGCFVLLLVIVATIISGTVRAGIISFLLFSFYENDVLLLFGSRDAFRFVGLLLLLLHASTFSVGLIQKDVRKCDFFFLAFFCFLSMQGHTSNVYVMFGMFLLLGLTLMLYRVSWKHLLLSGLAALSGTLLGVTKTIWLYIHTGNISSSTSLPFHGTPVIEQLQQLNDSRADWMEIWATYTFPVLGMMLLGILALLLLLYLSYRHREHFGIICGILILGMLLPLTGLLDWLGYECSRWFFEQARYRMYFLMLFALTSGWLLSRLLYGRRQLLRSIFSTGIIVFCFAIYLSCEYSKYTTYSHDYLDTRKETAQDYQKISSLLVSLTDGNIFTRNQALLYYLPGTPKLLYHSYSEALIQAKTPDEIQTALKNLDVGAIILPQDGLDYHDYSLLPFWDYINTSEDFERITQEDRQDSIPYTIFYLVP